MTSSQGQKQVTIPEALDGDDVEQYLKAHPDFFVGRSGLLADLTVPHETGQAVSLVERQVSILRDQNQRHLARLQELLEIARDNDQLSERLQRLALSLMEVTDLNESLVLLNTVLDSEFDVSTVVLYLDIDPAVLALDSARYDFMDIVFMSAGDDIIDIFADVLAREQPLCGELSAEQHDLLFGDRAGDIASAALVPLSHTLSYTPAREAIGFMAIGSEDPGRFYPEMGTMFLKYLGELVSHKLMLYVEQ